MEKSLQQRVLALHRQRWERLGLEKLLQEEQDYIHLWVLNAEVSNGTFDQYFHNSFGDHALDTLNALERLGSKQICDILKRAIEALPGGWCANREERWDRMDGISEEVIRKLTDEYYDAIVTEAAVGERAVERIYSAYQHHGLLTESGDTLG